MNAKQKIAVIIGVAILSLVGGFLTGPRVIKISQELVNPPYNADELVSPSQSADESANSVDLGSSDVEIKTQAQVVEALTNWGDVESSVAEMTPHANLIVRVRVVKVETRELRQMAPQYAADGTTITAYVEDVMPFTDSQMQVLEIYKGSAEDTITVMQTGGLPDAVAADAIPFSIAGDPIFTSGSELILFLKDITNDGVHSTGRKLYRIVNLYGRYELKDGNLITPADLMAVEESVASSLPTSLDELIAQIKQAMEN